MFNYFALIYKFDDSLNEDEYINMKIIFWRSMALLEYLWQEYSLNYDRKKFTYVVGCKL